MRAIHQSNGPTAVEILGKSRSFLWAAERTTEKTLVDGKFQSTVIPSVVCAAFSIELALKAIIFSEKKLKLGDKVPGHELEDLFNRIEATSQNKIASKVTLPSYPQRPGWGFKDHLSEISKAFVDWRYVFEVTDANVDHGFLLVVARAAQETASELIGA